MKTLVLQKQSSQTDHGVESEAPTGLLSTTVVSVPEATGGSEDRRVEDGDPVPQEETPGESAAEAAPLQGARAQRVPLLYVSVVSTKAEASSAVQRLLAKVRDDHGHLPDHVVFRLHSDKGLEFLSASLEKYCEHHGIRRTTTAGYDPSANGGGENAVGYVKRKGRQLLTGARLPSCWWGTAVLTAAFYSRCAAGLEEWPKLPYGTRAMVVKDPVSRNAFVPRALPATVFGPSERVPGGMVVF